MLKIISNNRSAHCHLFSRLEMRRSGRKSFILNSCDFKLRHSPLVYYFSFHHIFTNTAPISSSVCYSLPAVAHTKNFNCWIDRNFRSYHKNCIRECRKNCISANYNLRREFVSIENSKKMVWITDLDDPAVTLNFLTFSLLSFK